MAGEFDVAARLAEGLPAVADVETYVAACHRLGYQHGDLTAHTAQVRDLYGTEDGLDLGVLAADCAALSAAAAAAEDAARAQADLTAELALAWSGRGAAAAHEFVWRSGQAGVAVSSAVRGAADALAALRDELWRAVDAKVDAVQAIEARQAARRAEWLAAAKVVTTGSGDVAAASELVDLEVKPFVHDDIGSDWVAAMRSAVASIDAAYEAAITRVSAHPAVAFDVPGELGPRQEFSAASQPVTSVPPSVAGPDATSAAATEPAAALPTMPTSGPPPVPPSSPMASAAPFAAPPPPAAAVPSTASMPSMGDMAGAPSSPGGGMGGFGQQLADLIGGLFGSGPGQLDGPDGLDGLKDPEGEPENPDENDPDEKDPDERDPDEKDPDEKDPDEKDPGKEDPDDHVAADEQPVVTAGEPAAPDPAPVPAQTQVPPPPAAPAPPPPPPAVPEGMPATLDGAGQTPCEIAADQVPQVGK